VRTFQKPRRGNLTNTEKDEAYGKEPVHTQYFIHCRETGLEHVVAGGGSTDVDSNGVLVWIAGPVTENMRKYGAIYNYMGMHGERSFGSVTDRQTNPIDATPTRSTKGVVIRGFEEHLLGANQHGRFKELFEHGITSGDIEAGNMAACPERVVIVTANCGVIQQQARTEQQAIEAVQSRPYKRGQTTPTPLKNDAEMWRVAGAKKGELFYGSNNIDGGGGPYLYCVGGGLESHRYNKLIPYQKRETRVDGTSVPSTRRKKASFKEVMQAAASGRKRKATGGVQGRRKCEKSGCLVQPSFGMPDDEARRWCAGCAKAHPGAE
jgi:hypothetical protein